MIRFTKRLPAFFSLLLLTLFVYVLPCISSDSTKETAWIKSTNIYEIFVHSFAHDKDALVKNNNGNLKGIDNHLKNLHDMGVETIWLTPIYRSPSTHGYDVIDYETVDPSLGTLQDLKNLVNDAHNLKMKVILDIPINHCSNLNPLFLNTNQRYAGSENWFCWSSSDLGWPAPWDNNDNFNMNATWKKDSVSRSDPNKKYYYAAFDQSMPDFDYKSHSQEIVNYFANDVMAYWINNAGVDGFRCDAARYLEENGRNYQQWTQQRDQWETHNAWQKIREDINSIQRSSFLIAESPTETSDQLLSYYGCGTNYGRPDTAEFNSAFHFGFQGLLNNHIIYGKRDINFFKELYAIQGNLPTLNVATSVQDAIILSNHDSFAGARPATQMGGDTDKIKAVACLYLTLSGIPVIYYGEEVGMKNIPDKGGDDAIRGYVDWNDYNKQNNERDSVLTHYKKLLNLRNDYPALKSGWTYFVHSGFKYQPDKPAPGGCTWDSDQNSGGSPVTSIIRTDGKQIILVVHNTDSNRGAANNNGWTYIYVDLTERCGINIPNGTKVIPIKGYDQDKNLGDYPPLNDSNKPAYGVGWFGPLSTKMFYIGNDLPVNYKTYDNVLDNP